MRKTYAALLVMVMGNLALFLMVSCLFFMESNRTIILRYLLFYDVMLGQICLLTFWLVLGRRYGPLRLVLLVCGILVWTFVMCHRDGNHFQLIFLECTFLIFALLVGTPIGIARIFGLNITGPRDAQPIDLMDSQKHSSQFSLSTLFAWTTSLAICLGISRWIISVDQSAEEVGSLLKAFPLFLAITITAYVSLWLVLGTRWFYTRIIVFFLTVCSIICLIRGPFEPGRISDNIIFYGGLAILLNLSLLLIRAAGFRLVFQRKPNSSDTQGKRP
ncbi:MAG: hypothetical protein JXM70_16770 [Pirellulales bacterium]|nr:hypothetical protein [Pirellulales bacterium]